MSDAPTKEFAERGLRMSHAERLKWLEKTKREMRAILGVAAKSPSSKSKVRE